MPAPPHRPASQAPSTPRSQFHPTSPDITTRYSPEVVKRMERDICYRCNQIGHWSWHCPLTTITTTMPTPPHHPSSPNITTRYSPEVVKRMQRDICYRCNQIGHWSWHCPLTTITTTMPTSPHHPASQSPSTPRSQIHPTSPEITTRYSPEVVKRMQRDICYRCNQIGHWSWHCPLSSPNNNNSKCLSPSPKTDSPLNPTKIYYSWGHGFCVVKTSRSERNPGRKYYACPIKRGKPCRESVQRCDRPVDESYMQPPPYKYPECECGPAVCQKVKAPDAADKDCFVCPVGKDHGSCGYKVSEDELLDNSESIVPIQPSSQKHLGEGGDLYVENSKRMGMMEDFETPLLTAVSEHPKGDNATSEATPSRCVGFPEFEDDDDPQEVVNLVRWDAVERETFLLSHRSTPSRISCPIYLLLTGCCPTGWLGRLLFLQPTRSLKFSAAQPFFCCIFPSFDLIAVPKQAITFDDHCECNQQLAITDFSEHAQLSSDGCHTEVSGDVLDHSEVYRDVSVSPPSQSLQGSKRKPMSKAERERHAGLGLQQALLDLLDSLDPHEKESMRMAAEDTFVILDRLSVDYKQFSEHVWDFINCASAVADIDKSMENSLAFEEYNQCIEEERAGLFSQIQEDRVKTEALLDASNQRRQLLREEVSHLEALPHERRNQLSSCEMESLKIETHLGDLQRRMREADRTLKGRTAAADLAGRLNEERQTRQMAAKAALEKAKLELEK